MCQFGKNLVSTQIIIEPKLDQVLRQKDDSHKKAVVELSKGNVAETFKIHDKNIEQHDKKIVEASVAKYIEGSDAVREKTLLMSPTRKVRDEINQGIITELQKENKITGKIEKFEALKQKDLALYVLRGLFSQDGCKQGFQQCLTSFSHVMNKFKKSQI